MASDGVVKAQQIYDALQERWGEELAQPRPDWGMLAQLHTLLGKVERCLAAMGAEAP